MDGQYYQRNGQGARHFGTTVVYSRPLEHSPMPAVHNYVRSGPTEKASGYEGWVGSRDKEESVYAHDDAYIQEDEFDDKEFGAGEPPQGYPNVREENNMIVKHPGGAFIEDVYDDADDGDHDKVFAAPEPTKGYTDMRPVVREKDEHMYAEPSKGYTDMRPVVREKEEHMYAKNPMYSQGDQYNTVNASKGMFSAEPGNGYSNMRPAARPKDDNMYALNPALAEDDYSYNTYSPEAGRGGYMNMQKPSRPKEDIYASRPVHGDDHYSHQPMYSAEAGRGYMNHRQGGRRKEEHVYTSSPVFSEDEYGRKMYPPVAGQGYMNARQEPRRRENTMFGLNPVLSDDVDYNYKVYSTPAVMPVQGYGNMRHGGVREETFVSNQGYGRADFADNKMYYKTSHMEPAGMKKAVACGPWGGNTGNLFDDGAFTGIREIELTRSGSIVSIRVCYDMEGKAVWGNKNGGSHGMKVDKIVLEYPSEYLTHVSGYYGSMMLRGPTVLKSLTFHSNKRKYGPFGNEQGISFSSAGSREGKIVGFSGRIKNWYVESIGIHVMEVRPTRPAYDAFNMNAMRMRLEY